MSSCGVRTCGAGAEVRELRRGIAEGLLCAVGERGEKVFEKDSLFIHGSSSLSLEG